MVDFKLDSLATLPSVLDQWHFFLAMLQIVIGRGYFGGGGSYTTAWACIIGICGLIALIIVIASIFGKDAPKEYTFWYYIIGALAIIVIVGLCYARTNLGALLFALGFTMFIFYLYSAYLAKKG